MTKINIIADHEIQNDGDYNVDYYINELNRFDNEYYGCKNYSRNHFKSTSEFYSRYFKLNMMSQRFVDFIDRSI